MLGDDIDQEIRTTFQSDTPQTFNQDDEIRNKFKEHKKLLIRHLNRKWDVSSLETYISHRIVPRVLRDRTIPAEHLHTDRLLPKWKELCINHGLAVMRLIVDEEKIQLTTIQEQIEESARGLVALKDIEAFTKQNDILKKEIEKVQLNLKITKVNLDATADFDKDEVFDLTIRRGWSKSQGQGQCQQSRQRRTKSHSDSDDETAKTIIFFRPGGGGAEYRSGTTSKNKNSTKKQETTKIYQRANIHEGS